MVFKKELTIFDGTEDIVSGACQNQTQDYSQENTSNKLIEY